MSRVPKLRRWPPRVATDSSTIVAQPSLSHILTSTQLIGAVTVCPPFPTSVGGGGVFWHLVGAAHLSTVGKRHVFVQPSCPLCHCLEYQCD